MVLFAKGQQKCTGNCVCPAVYLPCIIQHKMVCYSGCTAQLNRPGFVLNLPFSVRLWYTLAEVQTPWEGVERENAHAG